MSECMAWQDLLTEYLEGDLAPDQSARLALHLEGCGSCSELLEDLRRVRRWAREAATTPPASDPWPSIEKAIRQRRGRAWRWTIAAAAVFIAGLAVLLRSTLPTSPPHALPGRFAARADPDAAIESLERIVASERHHLDPETLHTLEESLASIDAALARAERALSTDPDNEIYRRLLEESRERKRGVLRQAVRRAERWEAIGEGV